MSLRGDEAVGPRWASYRPKEYFQQRYSIPIALGIIAAYVYWDRLNATRHLMGGQAAQPKAEYKPLGVRHNPHSKTSTTDKYY
jgi:hypothetical protein